MNTHACLVVGLISQYVVYLYMRLYMTQFLRKKYIYYILVRNLFLFTCTLHVLISK